MRQLRLVVLASSISLALLSSSALADEVTARQAENETAAAPAPDVAPLAAEAADDGAAVEVATPAPVMPEPAPVVPAPTPAAIEPTSQAEEPLVEKDEGPSEISKELSEEWASSGFGLPITTLGTERFRGRFYEAGLVGGLGGPLAAPGLAAPVGLSGVHILESRGYVTKFTLGLLASVAVGMAGDKVHTGSKTEDYGSYSVRTDYYRTLTSDERAARNALPGEVFGEDYAMELTVYVPKLLATGPLAAAPGASGFELYLGDPGGAEGELPWIFVYAMTISYVGVDGAMFLPGRGPNFETNTTAQHAESFHYANGGVMLRVTYPFTSFLEARAQLDFNIIGLFAKDTVDQGMSWTHPLRLGLTVNVSDRLYGQVTGVYNVPGRLTGFSLDVVGAVAEVGVRL